jgi:hypothetical protein
MGAIVKLDHDDDASFDVVPGVITATPPPREREDIEGRQLSDTFEVPLMGIELASEFVVTVFYKEDDTEHAKFNTLFTSKANCPIQLITPHASPITKEFEATVKKVVEQEWAANGTLRAEVTFQRTSDVTVT